MMAKGLQPTNEMVPLGPYPVDFKAEQIVYSKYRASFEGGYIRLYADPSSCVIPIGDVKGFIAGLIKGDTPNCTRTVQRNERVNSENQTALDIDVDAQCWVVVELDQAVQWQFRTGGSGVTTKQAYTNDEGIAQNAGLHYVEADGQITDGPAPAGPGCRFVFFAVVGRDAYENQYFNFHVQLLQPGGANPIEIMIDPDIPNDGGKFP